MTYLHFIKNIFQIQDKNITLYEPASLPTLKPTVPSTIEGLLTYTPDHCPHCKSRDRVIKWGYKLICVHLGQFNTQPIQLKLKKQRFCCHHCSRTFIAETSLVNKHCSLSNPLKLAIKFALQEERSKVSIAKEYAISSTTINRILRQASTQLKPSLNWLPKHLSIDEFKSVKSVDYAMSCVIIDNEKHRLIDVIEDRKQTSLYDYFMRYDLSVRKKVKTITMDMNGAYYHFLPKLFPNAIVIIDRFHLVQRLNVALNRVRLQVMKELKYTQPTHYRKLKNLWKLLLKHEWELDFERFKSHRLFSGLITEKGIVDFLCSIDSRIEQVYRWVNRLKYAIHEHDYDELSAILAESHRYQLHRELRLAIQTMERYQHEIKHSLHYTLSNGTIEGFNNKIKNIKRSGYGYRNFYNLQARIRVAFLLTYHVPKTLPPVVYNT